MNSKSQQQSNGCGCLITLIALGLMVATILPSLLSSSNKAKQAEGRQYVGSMNRAQQAYLLENKTFSNNIEKLGLGIKTETVNYRYSTSTTNKAVFNYGIAKANYQTEYILFIPRRVKQPLKSYIGGVFIVPAAKYDTTTVAILCETNSFSTTKPPQPTYKNGVLTCAEGTKDLSK